MGAGRQKGGRRGGEEEKQKPQHPRKNRYLASPLSSPWETAAAPGLYTRLLQSGPAPLPAGSLRPWGAGRCILRAGRGRALQGLPW